MKKLYNLVIATLVLVASMCFFSCEKIASQSDDPVRHRLVISGPNLVNDGFAFKYRMMMTVGTTVDIKASSEAGDNITFKSSDPSVVYVDPVKGEATALKVGEAVITVTVSGYEDSDWSKAEIYVTVIDNQ